MKTEKTEQVTGKEAADILTFVYGSRPVIGPYKTTDASIYEKTLNTMSLADLQRHSIMVGVRPNGSRSSVIMRLKKEFAKANKLHTKVVEKKSNLSKEKQEELKELFPKLN